MSSSFRGIGMTSQRTRDRMVRRLREQGIEHPGVLEAMASVPRHIFLDEALASRAYEDTALPIGHGQTISQPYIVARMTEALMEGGHVARALEVGTGCGYQTAVLACLVERVHSVERITPLVNTARERLHALGIRNARLKHADGSAGWPEHAPFDGILVAAAPAGIPEPLIGQLAPGGRLVIPVGSPGGQDLVRVTRTKSGFEREVLERVSFVPMLGGMQ